MTEYTLTYTAKITEVFRNEDVFEEIVVNENAIANWIGAKLNVDDVKVENVKVFPRELES